MPELGAPELLIILAVVVLVFGGSRMAELGGSLGKGIKEFKKALKEDDAPAVSSQEITRPPEKP
jgi:sec-independent protein translocase protein TatA